MDYLDLKDRNTWKKPLVFVQEGSAKKIAKTLISAVFMLQIRANTVLQNLQINLKSNIWESYP